MEAGQLRLISDWASSPPAAPGIPRSLHFVCSRPLTLCEGGGCPLPLWVPACAGMTWVWTRLILPFGEILFDGWLSKDRRVLGLRAKVGL